MNDEMQQTLIDTIADNIRAFRWESYRLWECANTLSDDDTSRHEWVSDLATVIADAVTAQAQQVS